MEYRGEHKRGRPQVHMQDCVVGVFVAEFIKVPLVEDAHPYGGRFPAYSLGRKPGIHSVTPQNIGQDKVLHEDLNDVVKVVDFARVLATCPCDQRVQLPPTNIAVVIEVVNSEGGRCLGGLRSAEELNAEEREPTIVVNPILAISHFFEKVVRLVAHGAGEGVMVLDSRQALCGHMRQKAHRLFEQLRQSYGTRVLLLMIIAHVCQHLFLHLRRIALCPI
mmetsp:Transcript_5207/g.12819  ORF Transcript_5207/g.12819 Transcript_5207/m.12819 type:complete len:220 (-) Transcript_5207:1803-2462(-)